MKNIVRMVGIIACEAVIVFSMLACAKSGGGGKSINNADDLKKYLDSQPANSPDKPIKVKIINKQQNFGNIGVIQDAGKYVTLTFPKQK